MGSFKREFRKFLLEKILVLKKHNEREPILIFSDARGGSTWLMEILNEINGTSIIWEPLHNEFGVFEDNVDFAYDQFLPFFKNEKRGIDQFTSVLQGKTVNDWTLTQSPFMEFISAKRLIVKFVRANALIPWITDNYDFRSKPIYLLRHPIAVASSQLKNFYKEHSEKRIPPNPQSHEYQKHRDFLESLDDGLEQFVSFWCLHNYQTLKVSKEDTKWTTVFYEDLLLDPANEVKRIFSTLNEPVPDQVMNKINEPSRSNFNDHYVQDSKKQLEKWRNDISPEKAARIQDILNYFDIKIYSATDPYPIRSS